MRHCTLHRPFAALLRCLRTQSNTSTKAGKPWAVPPAPPPARDPAAPAPRGTAQRTAPRSGSAAAPPVVSMRVGLLLASLVVLASVPAADCGATKKSKRSRTAGSAAEPALRLPRSSRVDVGAYGVPARADWTKKAKLPALEARNATASPDSPDASAAMQRRIKRDGHFHIKGLLSPDEMSAFRPHIVAAALSIAARCETECETKDDPLDEKCRGCERVSTTPVSMPKSFIKARNLHRVSKVARRLVTSPRLAAVAAATLGVPTVRLYQDTAFFKEPGDRESSW